MSQPDMSLTTALAAFVAMALAAMILAVMVRSASARNVPDAKPRRIPFAGFTVDIAPAADDYLNLPDRPPVWFDVSISRDGRVLAEEMGRLTPLFMTVPDFPAPGNRSLMLQVYSGGAHCCSTTYMLMSGPSGAALAVVATANHYLDLSVLNAPEGTLAMLDQAFAYYSPAGHDVFLSYAGSPFMPRLLVFDGLRPRPDRPGEFPELYLAPYLEAMARPEAPAGLAETIFINYCGIMAGLPEAGTPLGAAMILAPDLRNLAPVVADDLGRAVREHDPVDKYWFFPAP